MWVIMLAVIANIVGLLAAVVGLMGLTTTGAVRDWFLSRKGLGLLCLIAGGCLLASGGQYKVVRFLQEPSVRPAGKSAAAARTTSQVELGGTVALWLAAGVLVLVGGLVLVRPRLSDMAPGAPNSETPQSSSVAAPSEPAVLPVAAPSTPRTAPLAAPTESLTPPVVENGLEPVLQAAAPEIPSSALIHTIRKGAQAYSAVAVMLVTTVVLFALVNVFVSFAFDLSDPPYRDPRPSWYTDALVRQGLPELSDEEVCELLSEGTGNLQECVVFWKETPLDGKWVTLHDRMFRHSKDQGPWPPQRENLNIFFFGGSTAICSGVGNEHTIASRLQEYLQARCTKPVKLYNFGICAYYCVCERILFETLLVDGHVPDIVVFLDGLNECANISDALDVCYAARPPAPPPPDPLKTFVSTLPVGKLLQGRPDLVQHIQAVRDSLEEQLAQARQTATDEDLARGIIKRYMRNKQIIEGTCQAFNIKPVFVWQPSPTYKYDLQHHLYARDELSLGMFQLSKHTYPMIEKLAKDKTARNLLCLADIQQDEKRNLYVDSCHYNIPFCNVIAEHIGRHVLDQKLLERATESRPIE